MKKCLLILFLFVLLAIPRIAYSQTGFCGFDSMMLDWKAKNPFEYYAARAAHSANVNIYREAHPYVNYYLTPTPPNGMGLSGGNNCPNVKYILPVEVVKPKWTFC